MMRTALIFNFLIIQYIQITRHTGNAEIVRRLGNSMTGNDDTLNDDGQSMLQFKKTAEKIFHNTVEDFSCKDLKTKNKELQEKLTASEATVHALQSRTSATFVAPIWQILIFWMLLFSHYSYNLT